MLQQLLKGKPITSKDGVFTALLKRIVEVRLEAEMHALFKRSLPKGNQRNARTANQAQSSVGGFQMFSPHDRLASFTPQTLPKRQCHLSSDIDVIILSCYTAPAFDFAQAGVVGAKAR